MTKFGVSNGVDFSIGAVLTTFAVYLITKTDNIFIIFIGLVLAIFGLIKLTKSKIEINKS